MDCTTMIAVHFTCIRQLLQMAVQLILQGRANGVGAKLQGVFRVIHDIWLHIIIVPNSEVNL